jgi:probable HAF family extracellular repeat protein
MKSMSPRALAFVLLLGLAISARAGGRVAYVVREMEAAPWGAPILDSNSAGQTVRSEFQSDENGWWWSSSLVEPDGRVVPMRPFGFSNAWARALNGRGQVIGDYAESLSTWPFRGFVYSNGVYADLVTLGGANASARDINDSGVIVGRADMAGGVSHAFVYAGGTMRDLGTLGSASRSSVAVALNGAGQVAGESETDDPLIPGADFPDEVYRTHAVLWSGGKMRDLGTFGGVESHATAINEAGDVVGYADTATLATLRDPFPSSPYAHHAFLYTQGVMKDLGCVYGTNSRAQGLNNRGQVFGYCEGQYDPEQTRPFIYENGAMKLVSQWISPSSPWVITSISRIRDDGVIEASGNINEERPGHWGRSAKCVLEPVSRRIAPPRLVFNGPAFIRVHGGERTLKGRAFGRVREVTYTTSRMTGPYPEGDREWNSWVRAKGTHAWRFRLTKAYRPERGVIITIVAHGPGGDSRPVTVKVK